MPVEVIAAANAIKYKSEDPHCHTLTLTISVLQTCLEDINGAFQDEQIMLELVGFNAYSSGNCPAVYARERMARSKFRNIVIRLII